jgi:hypothetical protein
MLNSTLIKLVFANWLCCFPPKHRDKYISNRRKHSMASMISSRTTKQSLEMWWEDLQSNADHCKVSPIHTTEESLWEAIRHFKVPLLIHMWIILRLLCCPPLKRRQVMDRTGWPCLFYCSFRDTMSLSVATAKIIWKLHWCFHLLSTERHW